MTGARPEWCSEASWKALQFEEAYDALVARHLAGEVVPFHEIEAVECSPDFQGMIGSPGRALFTSLKLRCIYNELRANNGG